MHLYRFDEADSALTLLPMAARRALDVAGLRLSLKGWQTLPIEQRKTLTGLGSAAAIDGAAVANLLRDASFSVESVEPVPDPAADQVPTAVTQAFGSERPISDAVWSALSPLDRYVLTKVAQKARPERLEAAYQEIIGASAHATHLGPEGHVRMVNVGEKPAARRAARAASRVSMNSEAYAHLLEVSPKGDVLGTARVAGIMAAKKTPELIPLCHSVALVHASIELTPNETECAVDVVATVLAFDRTGVEMEALIAATTAALTVYDMLKAFDRAMVIGPTRLLSKTGGRSGDYRADLEGA